MRLLRRGNSGEPDGSTGAADDTPATPPAATESGATTSGKGRPTPKRRDAEGRRRGPVAPAPMTAKEARARRKASRGTKQERRAAADERRVAAADRRKRMLDGEEKYLLPRDKGPVKGFVRDIVDARRNLVGLFMPMAVVMIMAMFVGPQLQSIVTLAMFVMLLFMVVEGFLLGRIVNRKVRERFPDATERPFALGWYAFVRASQLRKMRAPKPRVQAGATV